MVQLSHPYMTTRKSIALTIWTLVNKVMFLLLNTLSRFAIAFLLRNKQLLISWWQSLSAMILEPKKMKSVTTSIVSPSICHKVMELDAMVFVFWMLSLKPAFSLSSLTFINRLFSSSSLSTIRVVSSAYLRLLVFLPAISILACALFSLAFHMMYPVLQFCYFLSVFLHFLLLRFCCIQLTKTDNRRNGESVSHSVMSDSLKIHGLVCQAPLSMEFSRQEYWCG